MLAFSRRMSSRFLRQRGSPAEFRFATGGQDMRKRCFISVMVLISVALCAAASGEELPATRTVTGTRIGHYTNGAVPVDLSAMTIAAYIPSGSGYTVITGTGTSSGTFTIANVPTGFYLL